MSIKEFPDSFAKDAVMFWLGKSLVQLKSFEEAKKVFSGIKQQFPVSPFIQYVDKELEKKSRDEANRIKMDVSDAVKINDNLEARLSEAEEKARLIGKDLSKAIEDRDKLGSLLEQEKKKTEEMRVKVNELEGKEIELKTKLAKFEEQQIKKQPERIEPSQEQQKPQLVVKESKTVTPLPYSSEAKSEGKSVYSVQVSVFKNEANAVALAKEFKKAGYDAFTYKSTTKDKGILYRVLIGRFINMKEAAELANSIRVKEKIDVLIFCE
jgi:cell division septation protein DedD